MTNADTVTLSEQDMQNEASRQCGRPVTIRKIHISAVRRGDVIFHEGKAKTICNRYIKNG